MGEFTSPEAIQLKAKFALANLMCKKTGDIFIEFFLKIRIIIKS
jgi:hypothetical protein